MTTFDVFIKGINPERESETAEIRVNAAKALQISVEKLDELLTQPNGVCVRRNAEEQEAINYQRALSKLGLVCLYSPTKIITNLELEPLEEDISAMSVTCPHCQHEMAIEDGIEPEKCSECGVEIQKFLEQQRQNEEREALKAKLLASQNIQKAQEEKKQQIEAEKQRKAELEKEVLQELGVELPEKKPLNTKLLAIGAGLITLVSGAGYFFTSSDTAQPVANQTPVLATSTETNTAQNTDIPSSQIAQPLDAQEAMQKTHDQAAKVLDGFGLNPDAFANTGSSSNPAPSTSVASNTPVAQQSTATKSTSSSNTQNTPPVTQTTANLSTTQPQPTAGNTKTNFPELFALMQNDITWDKFLAQNSKILLDRQRHEKALQLDKFIVSNEIYVSAVGELLHAAIQGKQAQLVENYLTALNTRLEKLPIEQQAVYFAQAGGYLPIENGTNRLFAKADNLLASLPKPELQLPVVLKLAVIHSKSGNIASANTYFNKINPLLIPITDLELQTQLRAEIAIAYQDVNNTPVATQWLTSIEPLLKQLKPETLNQLALSYAKCNQWQNVLSVLSQLDEIKRDATLYQAIQTSLQAGFLTSAVELQKALKSPVYTALSNVLLAEYSPSSAQFLALAEQALPNLSPIEKTLVISQLVDYYGKAKKTAQIENLLTMSQETLASLPASAEKDALLEAVIKHYSHGFQADAASNLLTAIQTTPLKMRLNIEINELAGVSKLLK